MTKLAAYAVEGGAAYTICSYGKYCGKPGRVPEKCGGCHHAVRLSNPFHPPKLSDLRACRTCEAPLVPTCSTCTSWAVYEEPGDLCHRCCTKASGQHECDKREQVRREVRHYGLEEGGW